MGDFFAELKRRHIYRVAAAYAVVAWALLQLVNTIAPLLHLPDWAGTLFLVALLVGFPVVLLFAWVLELNAHAADGVVAHTRFTNLDVALLGALGVVIGIFAYQQLTPRQAASTMQASAPQATPGPNASGMSIAVLPFVNLSDDRAQEFFSDGMTEEITSALAKVPNLTVIGRTSAFQFKGKAEDLRSIGQALSANYLIEGSVRKAGDRVRITAQLIRAESGAHLWTENYDRQLTDIFAIQEDIAKAIAASLQVPLGLQQGGSLVNNRTNDLESYQLFLRGKALLHARAIEEASAALERAVARDPNFAPAWGLLAQTYIQAPPYSSIFRNGSVEEIRRLQQTAWGKTEMAAREAIRLDPRSASGYAGLASVMTTQKSWAMGEDLYAKALSLDPDDPDVQNSYGQFLQVSGRFKKAVEVREKLRTQEPFVPIFNFNLGTTLRLAAQTERAIRLVEESPATGAASWYHNLILAMAYATSKRYGEAADALLGMTGDLTSRKSIQDAAGLLRQAPAKLNPRALPRLDSELGFVYAHIGAPERVLEFPERLPGIGDTPGSMADVLWLPEAAPVRKTERFKSLVRKIGLVDYWKARGWPDLCRAAGADDFVCD